MKRFKIIFTTIILSSISTINSMEALWSLFERTKAAITVSRKPPSDADAAALKEPLLTPEERDEIKQIEQESEISNLSL